MRRHLTNCGDSATDDILYQRTQLLDENLKSLTILLKLRSNLRFLKFPRHDLPDESINQSLFERTTHPGYQGDEINIHILGKPGRSFPYLKI